jgi:hypothetical protein
MRIEAEDNFIDFQFCRAEVVYDPSLALSIEVVSEGFRGYGQRIWFRLPDTEQFVHQLETLERSRQGEAWLIPMDVSDYYPFRFKIFSIDTLGHMAISAGIMQMSYIGNHHLLVANKLSVKFEIDPSLLPYILKDFKKLFAQRSP